MEKGISIKGAIGLALAFMVIQLVIAIPLIFAVPEHLAMAITLPIAYIASIYFASRYVSMPSLQWDLPKNLVTVFVSIMFFMAVKFASSLPLEFIPGYEQMIASYMDTFGDLGAATMVVAALITPFAEEVFFRGMMQGALSERYAPFKSIFITALLFGLIHMIPVQVVAAFGMGLALGWIYYKTQSIWLPILLHTINNAMAFVAMQYMDEDSNLSMRADIDNDLLFIGIIIGSFVIAYIGYQYLDRKWDSPEAEIVENDSSTV